jgi:DUF4097 and DUF4098 domain-containing protein YvlB
MSLLASSQEVGHVDYRVGRKVIVSVTNSYGPITVRASDSKDIAVAYTAYAKSVTFDNERHGNRISLVSVSEHMGDNLAEYRVFVPSHAFVSLFARGPIHVEGLAGDVTIQTASHPVEVKNLDGAYLHVKTLDGSVTLIAVRNSHVYVQTINGSINISDSPGSWVEAISTCGHISYDGNPGIHGNYQLTSHSGDVDVSIPEGALVEVRTQSASDHSKQTERVTARTRQNTLFLRSGDLSRARFDLRSAMGRVRLKRPKQH